MLGKQTITKKTKQTIVKKTKHNNWTDKIGIQQTLLRQTMIKQTVNRCTLDTLIPDDINCGQTNIRLRI